MEIPSAALRVKMGVQDVSAMPSCGNPSAYGSSSSIRPSPSDSNLQTQPSSRKRKVPTTQPKKQSTVIDLTGDEPPQKRKSKKAKLSDDLNGEASKPQKTQKPKDEEKRLRRWRSHPPSSYLEVRDRALTQRMFALDRQRDYSNPDHPIESISLAGTTGNVYTIVIDKVPTCNCPHARKGNQCKHIAYVLSRVLRAPTELEYQLAFTSAELRKIFEKALPLPSETANTSGTGDESNRDGNRKPLEGECPICCVDFEPESGEVIVYCRAACGNNIHAECFKQWAATKRGGGNVTCPFCRSPWQGDEKDLKGVMKEGPKNAEGYVNVASQLGLSGRRDYSSYHSFWVRRQAMNGAIGWDEDGVMEHDY